MSMPNVLLETTDNAPVPSPGVSLHILDTAGLLFDRMQQQLYAANTCAAFIWCCLEDGVAPERIVTSLKRRFAFDEIAARYHYDGIIAHWRAAGLVDSASSAQRDNMDSANGCADVPESRPIRAGARPVSAAAVSLTYNILGMGITIDYFDRALFEFVHPNIAHLVARRMLPCDLRLELASGDDRIALFADGEEIDYCHALHEVVPMVLSSLASAAMHRGTVTYAIHAGAVRRGGTCILLPGKSGIGKSTLVAILAGEGFDALADDTVLMSGSPLALDPIPLGICLKAGSWPYVAPYYPDIEALPLHCRADGKSVRYINAQRIRKCRERRESLTANIVVFPRYAKGAATELTQIDTFAALLRLLDGTYLPGKALAADDIERLVTWISRIRSFELCYGNSREAADTLRSICTQ